MVRETKRWRDQRASFENKFEFKKYISSLLQFEGSSLKGVDSGNKFEVNFLR